MALAHPCFMYIYELKIDRQKKILSIKKKHVEIVRTDFLKNESDF